MELRMRHGAGAHATRVRQQPRAGGARLSVPSRSEGGATGSILRDTARTQIERLLRSTPKQTPVTPTHQHTGKHAPKFAAKKERFAHSRRIRPSAAGEVQGATGRAAKDAGGIAAIAVSVLVASAAECKVSAGLHHCVAMLSEHTTHTPSRSATPTLVLAGKRSDHRLLLLLIWKVIVITPPEQRRLGPAPRAALAGASSR